MKKLLIILTLLLGFSNIALAADRVNVYYFYGKPRCGTCVKIETYTKAAIASMNDRKVVYQGVDMEKPENKNMVKKYKLFTKSVVLSKTKNGKEQWKNLDKIWLKVSKEADFKNYITTETKTFKGAK